MIKAIIYKGLPFVSTPLMVGKLSAKWEVPDDILPYIFPPESMPPIIGRPVAGLIMVGSILKLSYTLSSLFILSTVGKFVGELTNAYSFELVKLEVLSLKSGESDVYGAISHNQALMPQRIIQSGIGLLSVKLKAAHAIVHIIKKSTRLLLCWSINSPARKVSQYNLGCNKPNAPRRIDKAVKSNKADELWLNSLIINSFSEFKKANPVFSAINSQKKPTCRMAMGWYARNRFINQIIRVNPCLV